MQRAVAKRPAVGYDGLVRRRRPILIALAAAAALPGCATEDVWRPGRAYLVRRANPEIEVGPRADPLPWRRAMVIRDFVVPVTHASARDATEMRMLWDDRCLYVRFTARDGDLRGTYTGRADPLWREDVVEVFLRPGPDRRRYYEFEVNPIGTLLALRIPEGHTTFDERARWAHHVRAAAGAEGTPNDPGDRDRSFTVVLAVPWADLDFAGARAPAPGDVWQFIGARCNLSADLPGGRELSACVPLSKVDFHLLSAYPSMRFAE